MSESNKRKAPSDNSSSARRVRRQLAFSKLGFEVMPCSRCFVKNLPCVALEDIKTCQRCDAAGESCDGTKAPITSLTAILAEYHRLESVESLAESELLDLQQRVTETLSRLVRLRKQKAMARQRGLEMVRKEASDLDDLDRMESEAAGSAQSAGAVDIIDWSSVGFENVLEGFDPQLLSGGTGQERRSPQHAS
jgi:hypothetical protein